MGSVDTYLRDQLGTLVLHLCQLQAQRDSLLQRIAKLEQQLTAKEEKPCEEGKPE